MILREVSCHGLSMAKNTQDDEVRGFEVCFPFDLIFWCHLGRYSGFTWNWKAKQTFRRLWPISSADLPMTSMERTEHHFGPFWEKDFGAISGGPFSSRPLCFTAEMCFRGNKTERRLRVLRLPSFTL